MSTKIPNYEECLLTRRQNSQTGRPPTKTLKGPLRVVRLCLLGILLPCLLVSLILYMRYRVYVEQFYPLAVSDMRMLDNRISTTWCQRQLIRTNATFNAFLLPEPPTISNTHAPMTMVRHLELEDDTKEYWGFYLLRGSTVTISSCVRWPGASLIVIRGHKHLHECAYIGDNSSEELDEMMEAIREGTYRTPDGAAVDDDSAPSNTPNLMKRHREDVQFHDPSHIATQLNHTLEDEDLDTTDINDPKMLKKILESLNEKAPRKQHAHIHRNSTIGKGETGNLEFENNNTRMEQTHRNSATTESEEMISDVLRKLQKMGDEKGGSILEKLNARYANKSAMDELKPEENVMHIRGRQYQKPEVQFDDNIDKARRRKRELILQTAALSKSLNDDDTADVAQEEDFVPDGIADHHATLNENTLNDKSNSEFWSSFSSSEEALLNCAGLILNLPLSPHTKCQRNLSDLEVESAYLANRITYKVPTNGYYFFVFNSENEVQTNYIRVHFHIEKTVYNVSNTIAKCANSTEQCALDLRFFSDEKLVMELPIKEDQDLFNQEYVVVSVCEPRTGIYILCVILVPILVILFAFQ